MSLSNEKEYCCNGHEYTEETTLYYVTGGKTRRYCKICKAVARKRANEKEKLERKIRKALRDEQPYIRICRKGHTVTAENGYQSQSPKGTIFYRCKICHGVTGKTEEEIEQKEEKIKFSLPVNIGTRCSNGLFWIKTETGWACELASVNQFPDHLKVLNYTTGEIKTFYNGMGAYEWCVQMKNPKYNVVNQPLEYLESTFGMSL